MQVWCDWQVTRCEPYLSALEVRFSRLCAIQIDVYLYLTHWGSLKRYPRPPSWFMGQGPRGKGRRVGRGNRRGGEGREARGGSPRMPKSRVGKPTFRSLFTTYCNIYLAWYNAEKVWSRGVPRRPIICIPHKRSAFYFPHSAFYRHPRKTLNLKVALSPNFEESRPT